MASQASDVKDLSLADQGRGRMTMGAPGTAPAPGVPGAALCAGQHICGHRERPRGPWPL